MDAIAVTIAIAVVLYVAIGLATGIAFVVFGVTTVQSAPVTIGARILLLPGATALWPLVVCRWFKSSHPQ